MAKKIVLWAVLLFAVSISNEARAQTPGGIMNMFTNIMGAAIVNTARIEWSKVPANETACIDQELRQQGSSVGGLIQNGIVPNDPRIAGARFNCRTAAPPAPNVIPNAPAATLNLSAKP